MSIAPHPPRVPAEAVPEPTPGRRSIERAVIRHDLTSRRGFYERVFARMFSDIVYPQIWEDPGVDLEALALKDGESCAIIASAGCNALNYLTQADVEITALDLNPGHIALNKLRLAALLHLPDYPAFLDFFGRADQDINVERYERYIAPHLDERSRRFWEGRNALGRRRITYFAHGFYRYGTLGLALRTVNGLARLNGFKGSDFLACETREERERLFTTRLLPILNKPFVRWLVGHPAMMAAIAIPPAQADALRGDADHLVDVLIERARRLLCDTDPAESYFYWQVLSQRYPVDQGGPLPLYLQEQHFETLRARGHRIAVRLQLMSDHLAQRAAASCDAYVFLDALDWMTDRQLTDLWSGVARTARPGARIVYRTAAVPSVLPGRIPDDLLRRFRYEEAASRDWTRRDQSAVYGGLHLYVFEG